MKKSKDTFLMKKEKKKYHRAKTKENSKKLITLNLIKDTATYDFVPLKKLKKPEIINEGEIKNLQNELETLLAKLYPKGFHSNSLKYISISVSGVLLCLLFFYFLSVFLVEKDSKEFILFLKIISIFICFIVTIVIMAYCFKKDQKLRIEAEKKIAVLQSKWNMKFKNENLKVKISLKNVRFFYEEKEKIKENRFEKNLKLKEKFYKSEKKLPTIMEEEASSKIEIFEELKDHHSQSHISDILVPDNQGDCEVKVMVSSRGKRTSHESEEVIRVSYNIGECFSTDKDN